MAARRTSRLGELHTPGSALVDFLTWFEYTNDDSDAFEDLVRQLRDTEEWTYVEREVDIRLVR